LTHITDNPAMVATPAPDADTLSASLRRLCAARWLVLGVMAVLVVVTDPLLGVPLPLLPMLLLIAIAAAQNGITLVRLGRGARVTASEFALQLWLDLGTLGALVFFSGGATNPLVSLLLPPVAIAALALPTAWVLTTGALAIALYSLLMGVYLPLPLADGERATRLHLGGMWITFAVSSGMIAWFVVRLSALIRQRDAALAAAREAALRDERLVALGALAAGAAHELGTPLATMAVVAGELARDANLPGALHDDVTLLRRQISVCKDIITGLSRRAGAERLDAAAPRPVDQWLAGIMTRWEELRPDARHGFTASGPHPPPDIVADPTLGQAVINLLNNAANTSPQPVEILVSWSAERLVVAIRDHGPGFPPNVLAEGGQRAFPAHAGGSGIGLLLARSAIERRGGTLALSNDPAGGAIARLELPLAPP
jgi:two-component system sensor histidine kinase RegB